MSIFISIAFLIVLFFIFAAQKKLGTGIIFVSVYSLFLIFFSLFLAHLADEILNLWNLRYASFNTLELIKLFGFAYLLTIPLWGNCYFQWRYGIDKQKKAGSIWIRYLIGTSILAFTLTIIFIVMIMFMYAA